MMNLAIKYLQISSKKAAFRQTKGLCLVDFRFCLLNKVTQSNDKQTIACPMVLALGVKSQNIAMQDFSREMNYHREI
jgi:hypothetical protein